MSDTRPLRALQTVAVAGLAAAALVVCVSGTVTAADDVLDGPRRLADTDGFPEIIATDP